MKTEKKQYQQQRDFYCIYHYVQHTEEKFCTTTYSFVVPTVVSDSSMQHVYPNACFVYAEIKCSQLCKFDKCLLREWQKMDFTVPLKKKG